MGRPRQGTDLKLKVSIRLSPEAVERLATMGANRSAIIESLILSNPLRAALDAKIAAVPARKPANTGICPHPREQRQQFDWGTRCGRCKSRL